MPTTAQASSTPDYSGGRQMKVADTKVMPEASEVIPADVSALAGGLELLVLEFDKLRRSALGDAHLTPESAYLLRLAAQPDGVRLTVFRQQVGIRDSRASQIVGPLEARHLVERTRTTSDARTRVVRATDKGSKMLAKLDAQLAEALRAELASGEASPLHSGLAAVQFAPASPAQAAEGHDDAEPSRPRRAGRPKPPSDEGPTLFDPVD